MNNYKKKVLKIVISGLLLFMVGIYTGYQLNNNTISSIQGYLFNMIGLATDSNASDSNASDSNASDSNASDSNASDSNASDANAYSSTDNIIYLQHFKLNKTNAKVGEKVYIELSTSGATNSSASVVFSNNSGSVFTVQVKNINNNPYIEVPKTALASTYDVESILLVGTNSNHTTFSKQYSRTGYNSYNFNSSLTVTSNTETKKITINNLQLKSKTASIGEKVYIDLNTSEKINSLQLTFASTNNETFFAQVRGLSEKSAYFEIPSTVVKGTYNITNLQLTTENGTYLLTKSDFSNIDNSNTKLDITSQNDNLFTYNNEDINAEVLNKIYNAKDGSIITINVGNDNIINEELFNTIKGQNKKIIINYDDNQIIFNGTDIKDSKTIDVTMKVDKVSNNEKISNFASNGIIVDFPNNGNLPGKALIRIKTTDEIDSILNDNGFVYIYNESTNNFCAVDLNAKKTSDGYYEFTINHNSSYLIVNEKLDSKYVVEKSYDNVVTFQKSDKIYLLLIIIGVVVIIAVVVVIIILKKKNKKTINTSIDNIENNIEDELQNFGNIENKIEDEIQNIETNIEQDTQNIENDNK